MRTILRSAMAVVAGAVLLAGTTAGAAKYGAAGCGLGALVLGDEPGMIQIVAGTLNAIALNQSFGISSGTLECGEAATKSLKKNAQLYIEGNRELVARDIARGQGDTIIGLSAIAGCPDSKKVGAALQSQYEKIFPTGNESDEKVSSAIIDALKAQPELACKQLI
ncbi:MAG: DUF3015 family protein [Myxococcaceae bacterium]|nr:DUF3015 family protein [Myxococcaceae bacterium]